MKNVLKFIVSLSVFLAIAFAVHAYVFTIYSVPENGLVAGLVSGSRVIVNRMADSAYEKGDVVVYTDSTFDYIGQIKAVPGDTVVLDSALYVIPQICCRRCGCPDCKYYLIKQGKNQMLVHKHLFIGKARKLF